MFFKLLISKLLIILDDIFYKKDSIGSKLVLKLDKNILFKLLKMVKGNFIIVTGTNGKTTVKSLLKDIFNKEDMKVIVNDHSRNNSYGILYALVKGMSLLNRRTFDYIVFEIKDLELLDYFNDMNPEFLIVTNLFKEQIARKNNFKEYLDTFKEKLSKYENTTFILNGDDPAVAYVSEDLKGAKRYYGIDNSNLENEVLPVPLLCLKCGGNLNYTYRTFGQLGEYDCEGCSFDKPELDYLATNTTLKNGIYFDLLVRGDEYPFDLPAEGVYNIYNILATIALVGETDIGLESVELLLEKIEIDDNTTDSFYIKRPIFLEEALNITSIEEILEDIKEDEETMDILIINDNKEDYSNFIYSLDISILKEDKIKKIYVSGLKGYDIALGLQSMGVDLRKLIVDMDIDIILGLAMEGKANKLYIINMDEDTSDIGKQLYRLEKKWSNRHNG